MTKRTEGPDEANRRSVLKAASNVAMVAGLAGGYGAFAAIAGRYLYPTRPADKEWQFVIEADRVATGESLRYETPNGETVNITRTADNGRADDFIALSSACPHLGCQVHWEAHNDRYFCPCHNGVFAPSGVGVSGPPGDAGQSLPRYGLKLDSGLLYVEVELQSLVDNKTDGELSDGSERRSEPGHDPCLEPRKSRIT